MHVITVLPLSKKVQKEQLTYFTQKEVALGDIVTVPVRKQQIKALVVDIEKASDVKTEVKNAAFNLKKIISVQGPSGFPLAFMRACARAKTYFVTTTGTLIDIFVPNALLLAYTKAVAQSTTALPESTTLISEKIAYQASLLERMSYYKTIVRTSFAKKESVFLCCPSHRDVQFFLQVLGKGVEQHVFAFSGEESDAKIAKRLQDARDHEHPILFIATGSFISFDRPDIATYIVEKENRDIYITIGRPHADIRVMVELVAEERHARFILADTTLRIETYNRILERELTEAAPITFRITKQYKEVWIESKGDDALMEETKNSITRTVLRGEQVFIMASRKGVAGVTICRDCGRIVHCATCKKALSLFEKENANGLMQRLFMCTHCGTTKTANVVCENCASWNLYPVGSGTQKVVAEVKAFVDPKNIFLLDKEHAKTHKEAKQIVDAFYATKGGVLVGTEMALYYLLDAVPTVVISSLDTLLLIPSHSITDKVIALYNSLAELTEENLIIQTRKTTDSLVRAIKQGTLFETIKEELSLRKILGYPPYTELIKVTIAGLKENLQATETELAEHYASYNPAFIYNPIRRPNGRHEMSMLLKVPRKTFSVTGNFKSVVTDTALAEKLASLPQSFDVTVHPTSLL